MYRPKALDAQLQSARLSYVYGSRVRKVRHGAWEMTIQPTDLSSVYRVRIEYDVQGTPRVEVLDPLLARREGDASPIPHTYDEASRPRPCLYYMGDWKPSRSSVALTLVPWIAEWLYFYEIWHATGKWLGGGVEHAAEKTE